MKKQRNKQRCIVSNKLIDGKEVIIKEYAKDYLLINGEIIDDGYD